MSISTVSIHGKEHPTYAGVLGKAHDSGLESIKTELLQAPLSTNNYMAIIKATVVMNKKTFEGIGDATPKNVNAMIAPHIVRMAETRAKGRALRDALNITEALAEELMDETTNRTQVAVTPENDVMERHNAQNDVCRDCGAPRVKNPRTGKWFCQDKCWLKEEKVPVIQREPEFTDEDIADNVPF